MTTLSEFKVDVDQASLAKLVEALGTFKGHLNRHMATAVNRTARTVGVEAAQQLGKVVNFKLHSKNKFTTKRYTKAATLKKAVWRKQNATADSPRTAVKLWGGHPFPVRWHEAYEFQRKRKDCIGRHLLSNPRWRRMDCRARWLSSSSMGRPCLQAARRVEVDSQDQRHESRRLLR